jgi:hypothetical protein
MWLFKQLIVLLQNGTNQTAIWMHFEQTELCHLVCMVVTVQTVECATAKRNEPKCSFSFYLIHSYPSSSMRKRWETLTNNMVQNRHGSTGGAGGCILRNFVLI